MPTVTDHIRTAKALARQKRYNEARRLLRRLNDPEAAALLEKIDRVDPPKVRRTWVVVLQWFVVSLVGVALVLGVAGWLYVRSNHYQNIQADIEMSVYCAATGDPCDAEVDQLIAEHPALVADCHRQARTAPPLDRGLQILECVGDRLPE